MNGALQPTVMAYLAVTIGSRVQLGTEGRGTCRYREHAQAPNLSDTYLRAAREAVVCCATFERKQTNCANLEIRTYNSEVLFTNSVIVAMDLSCEENMQSPGNSGSSRQVDMCVAGPDRALDTDPRVILNLLTLERSHALHADYFQNVQIDIQPFMRKVVTTWMLEVRLSGFSKQSN